MVFRRQYLLTVGTEGLGRHTRLRSKLWGTEDCGRHRGIGEAQTAEIKAAGTGHCVRHRGSWEAQGDWGRHRRRRARLWGTQDYGRHQGSWEAHIAEFRAGGTRDPGSC